MSDVDHLCAVVQAVCEDYDIDDRTMALGKVIVSTILAHASSRAVARKALDDLAVAMRKYVDDLWDARSKLL